MKRKSTSLHVILAAVALVLVPSASFAQGGAIVNSGRIAMSPSRIRPGRAPRGVGTNPRAMRPMAVPKAGGDYLLPHSVIQAAAQRNIPKFMRIPENTRHMIEAVVKTKPDSRKTLEGLFKGAPSDLRLATADYLRTLQVPADDIVLAAYQYPSVLRKYLPEVENPEKVIYELYYKVRYNDETFPLILKYARESNISINPMNAASRGEFGHADDIITTFGMDINAVFNEYMLAEPPNDKRPGELLGKSVNKYVRYWVSLLGVETEYVAAGFGIADRYEFEEAIKFFVERNVDVNQLPSADGNKLQWTIAHFVADKLWANNQPDDRVMRFLIEKGVDINPNAPDLNGDTPLHIATKTILAKNAWTEAEMVLDLFKLGADPTIRNEKGFTMEDIIAQHYKDNPYKFSLARDYLWQCYRNYFGLQGTLR